MHVVLVRHGDAGAADARRWPDDRARPLTARGEAEHRAVARAMRRAGLRFDRLLTSPLVRARQTAAITAEVFAWTGPVEVADFLGDRATPAGVLGGLAAVPDVTAGATVLCVGHEPTFSAVTALLVAGSAEGARVHVRKSAVVGIDCGAGLAPGRGTLTFLLPPDLLAPLA